MSRIAQLKTAAALALLFSLKTTLAMADASASESPYVSVEELDAEIAKRKEDLKRTRARVLILSERLEEAENSAKSARSTESAVEKIVTAKMRVFYKLTRYGGSLRLLLGSRTPTELLFRLRLLEHLLSDSLQARRRAGLRVVETAAAVQKLIKERDAAERMLEMLDATLSDLTQERNRRTRR